MNGILNTRKKLYNVAVISTLRKSTYLDGSLINDIYCEIHTNDLKYLYKKYLNFVYFSNDDVHSFYRFRFVDLEVTKDIHITFLKWMTDLILMKCNLNILSNTDTLR